MNREPGIDRALLRLEAALGRSGERLALAARVVGRVEAEPSADLPGRLAAIRGSGAECDLPKDLVARLFGPFAGKPARGPEWLASRTALAEAGERVAPKPGERLGAALAHTGGLAAAIARAAPISEGPAWAGIDVEPAGRPISGSALRRIGNPGDVMGDAPPIALWSLKEALYKAVGQGSFREFHVRVEAPGPNFWFGDGSWRDFDFRVGVVISAGYLIAAALAGDR